MGQPAAAGESVLEREVATSAITTALDEARSGRGSVLFLVGEAGLGKTTMLGYARLLAEPAFAIGAGRGDATEATLPFGIVSQALDDLGSSRAFENAGAAVSGSEARAAHFYAVLRFLEARGTQPMALLLDDLQWADPDSVALLSFLARRITPLPIAIIGALRPWPPGAYDAAQQLAGAADARIERLVPLSPSASATLLAERLARAVSDDVIRSAPSLTSGNPLLLELLADKIAEGVAAESASDLLLARFSGGRESERRFVEAASIFGTVFRPVRAAELAGLPSNEGDRSLEALCASGVLRASGPGTAEFAHPLLRQAVYERIPQPVRERRHASAFRILVAHSADAAEAADHAARAELDGDADAIATLERAARQAQSAGALATAGERFAAAARLAGSNVKPGLLLSLAEVLLAVGDAPAARNACRRVLAMDQLADAERIVARRLLGRVLFIAGDANGAQLEFQQAVDESAASAPADTVQTLLEAVYVSWPSGGPARATPLARRARALAVDLPLDVRLRAEAAWAFSAFVGGDPSGIGLIAQAAEAAEADPMSDLGAFAWTWGAIGLYGNVAKWTERFDEAERAFTIGVGTAERLNLPVAIASLAVMHGDTLMRVGRLDESLRWLDRASSLAELAPERAFWAAVAHGYNLIEVGRNDEARSWAETARSLAEPSQTWPGWIWMWHVDAQLAMQDRRRDDACALFERIERLADQCGVLEPCVVPWMGDAMQAYTATGRLLDAARILERLESSVRLLPCRIPRVVIALAKARRSDLMGDAEQASAGYQEALALARAVSAPPLTARVLLANGLFLRKHDELVKARTPLAEAIELAESVGAEPLAARAAEELGKVGGRRRRRDEDPDALSFAERRVASLAGQGLRGKELAARLNVSINTIETHLQHVYRKLGITSQLELMRLASQGKLPALDSPGTTAASRQRAAEKGVATARLTTRPSSESLAARSPRAEG